MGQSKQLLPLDGKPFIVHCVEALTASGIRDITVVLGQNSETVQKALTGYPVRILLNVNAASDMAESVRIGLSGLYALERPLSGVLISLSDHPLVQPETLKTLSTIHRKEPDTIIIPAFKGKRGHPSLFPMHVLVEILKGGTLRDIVNKNPSRVRIAEVMDEGVVVDIDTREEYETTVKKLMKPRQST